MRRANFAERRVTQDLAFTLPGRSAETSGFTFLVVGALAIGIGANTRSCGMIDAVFVRGLPSAASGGARRRGRPDARQLYSSDRRARSMLSAPVTGRCAHLAPSSPAFWHRARRIASTSGRRRRARASRGKVRLRQLLLRAQHQPDWKSVRRRRGFGHRRRRRSRSATDTGSGAARRSRRHRPEHHDRRRALHRSSASRPGRSPATSSSNGPISGFRWDARRDAPHSPSAARPVHELAVAARPPQAGRDHGAGTGRVGAARHEEHSRERQCEGRLGAERRASHDVRVLGRQGFFQSP